MRHEYTDNVVCAHCGHEHEEWWEFHLDTDGSTDKVTCHSCNKEFEVTVDVSYSFTSEKITCDNCDLGEEYHYNTVEQELCDKWNEEEFLGRTDHKPYKVYRRDCKVCDDYETRQVYI